MPCLDYVIGEICIAGKSLAKGYMNDVTLSDQKFQFITEIEERVYKTGDLGLYREDGVIEFVGRKDTQVKINGYRVELGEIENALKRYPGIENAVVVKSNEGSLTAYILGNKGKQEKKVIEKKIIDEEKEFKFQFTRKEFQEWIEKADKTALMYILRFLVNEKVFEDVEKRYSFEQIKGILNVIPKYEQLLIRWLMALKENKYLHLDKEGFYIEEIYSTNIAEKAEEEWKLVDKKIQYSDVLMEYIHESSMHLNGDKGISIGDLCALHGEYEILGMSFRKLNKLSQEERLKKIYENVSGDEKIDADNVSMFKMLFLLFRHSFKGIMHYEPSVYVGDVQAMFVEDDTKHFFPVRNITNKSLWENIVLGQLTVDYIPGEHISCLKEPYVREVAKLIK